MLDKRGNITYLNRDLDVEERQDPVPVGMNWKTTGPNNDGLSIEIVFRRRSVRAADGAGLENQ